MRLITALLFLMAIMPSVRALTIYVPDDYGAIQYAIDGAANGDTIIVRPGTYPENIDFSGKNIVLQSEMGPENTVIDGGQMGSVINFQNRETRAVVQGFTITNGNGTLGGGGREGGGIRCVNESSAIIIDNIITENSARYGGGIIANWDIEIRNNQITANTAKVNGGGLFLPSSGSVMVENNRISENSSNYSGGGIELYQGTYGLIRNNVIAYNQAGTGGGAGIKLLLGSALILNNNMIHDNTSSGRGGGIYLTDYSQALIVNDTIWGNATNNSGGGVACRNNSRVELINSIVRNNTAGVGGDEIDLSSPNQPSECVISYSNVPGGVDSVTVAAGCTLNWGAEMMDDDPRFASSAEGDFHLTRYSSCINRGTPWNAPRIDIDNEPRLCMGKVDLGADEYSGTHTLEANTFVLSHTGGSVVFSLLADASNAGRTYLMTGGLTGTSPGYPLPGGLASIPVNFDEFTFSIVFPMINTPVFHEFTGTLAQDGIASASLNCGSLSPLAIGWKISFAYCLNWPFEFVSNPVEIEIVVQ